MTTFKISLQKDDTEVPQFVIFYKTLSNDAMRPSCSQLHLTTAHSILANKPKEFLVIKSHLKKAKWDILTKIFECC